MKEFTQEGRFESGLDDVLRAHGAGTAWAFVAVIGEHYGARLGVAIANESGYAPIPEHWANADSYDEMEAHAQALNDAEGIAPRTAALIVVSTMGGRAYAPLAAHA